MARQLYKIALLFTLGGVLTAYNNCGAPLGTPSTLKFESANQVGPKGMTESYETFTQTVYPITRSHCISCHTTQNPTSAHEDPREAHNSIIGQFKVNFDNVPASRLVRKLRDEHHNCWSDCEANAAEMQAAVERWAQVFEQSPQQAPIEQPEIPVNAITTEQSRSFATELADPKNKANNIISLSFDISPYVGFPNAYFVVDIKEYDQYSYKFSKPRIKTPTEKVHVKNVKILINGKYDPQNALYTVIDKTTTAQDRSLSTSAMVAVKDKGSDLDQISISFEKLRLVTTQTQSYMAFEDTVYQVTRGNCSSCHSGSNPAGHASQDPNAAHDVVISRSLANFTTVTNSPLVRKLKAERHNCGLPSDCDDLAAEMQLAIEEWKSRR